VAELERMAAAGQLDRHCVDALLRELPRIEDIRRRFRDDGA
jgi:hypothetical protein